MMREPISRMHVGVFVPSGGLHDWEWDSVELLRAGGATCLFIQAAPSDCPPRSKWTAALDRLVSKAAGLTTTIQPRLYTPAAADHDLTLVLFFGKGEIPAGLPGRATLGVWRFTPAAGIAGGIPFLAGLHRRDDVVSFGLEQILDEDTRARPLMTGYFRARGERNRSVCRQILQQASRWPLLALQHLVLNGELPRAAEESSHGSRSPGALTALLSLLSRDALLRLSAKLASYFVLETWNVGFVRMDATALLAGAAIPKVALLPRLELGRYIADPFILSTTPELSLLVEDYTDFGVGRISKATVRDPFGASEVDLEIWLESRHHMSYPFLFRDGENTFCLPECHQSNSTLLYRYDGDRLVPASDIVPGARSTDGTILFHNGLYWLFCGLENDDDQVNLHLFYSTELQGGWSAHPLNPVKSDVRSSRSAGPIISSGGRLFRPTQDCSRSYGYGISVNRIDVLSRTQFQETVVSTIRPETVSKACKGIHTLTFADDLMVVDAKFQLTGFEPLLVRTIRRLRRLRRARPGAGQLRSQSA